MPALRAQALEADAAPGVDPARVLVAVPALNEERHIEACLRSLMSDPAMHGVSIVVADGGSTDRTRGIVLALGTEFPNIALIRNPGRLQAAAVNRIVAECARPWHAYLVRCDAHSTYPPGFALDVAASLEARGTAALATAMDAAGRTCLQRGAAWIVDTPLGCGGAPHRGGRCSGPVEHGHHAGIRLDWFRRIGGYDESFSHNEDAEFDHRLGLAGGAIWLDAGIRPRYAMRDSLAGIARQYWNYGRGRARTVLKHRLAPRLRQCLPPLHFVALTAAVLAGGHVPLACLYPVAYGAVVLGAGLATAVRHRSLCGLAAAPALCVMHYAWGAGFVVQVLARGSRP
jgi:succinoglycan biosynthesis protein ExoA